MQKVPRVTDSFIVRVEDTTRGQIIYLHDLKTQKKIEFDSWPQLCRYLQIQTSLKPPDIQKPA